MNGVNRAKSGRLAVADSPVPATTHTTTSNYRYPPQLSLSLSPGSLSTLIFSDSSVALHHLGLGKKRTHTMSSFAALMALSASQTKESEAAVQSALAERQRKEALKRKQQEEKEAKEREIEKKLRMKHLQEQKREEDRQKRLQEQRRKKEEELRRKEDEQRDALRYGPKRPKSEYPSSSQGRRRPGTSDDDDESGGGSALTREEKRKLRLQRELNYGTGAHKRSAAGIYRKAGRRLPGGAVDTTATNGASSSANTYSSVKERLAHEPPALIKLNVHKRDTRTIDEILQDRARQKTAKTLSGDDARGFDNWFGKAKAKAESLNADSANGVSRASSMISSRSNSPERKPSANPSARPTKSLSSTPPAPLKPSASARNVSTPATSQSSVASRPASAPVIKGTGIHVKAIGKALDKSHISNGANSKSLMTKKASFVADKAPRSVLAKPSATSKLQSLPLRKRHRSPSLSDSPPPPKRRTPGHANSISAEIWKMFGKDRTSYIERDVFSDDEDMEADAFEVEHEELYRCAISCALALLIPKLTSFAIVLQRQGGSKGG